MQIELNDDQTRVLIQMLLSELEATKTLLSMEEDHVHVLTEDSNNKFDEIVALNAEIKALMSAKAPDLPIVKSIKMVRGKLPKATKKAVEPVKRGRPKKVAA